MKSFYKFLFLMASCVLSLFACEKTKEDTPPPPVPGTYHISVNSVNAISEPDSVFFSTAGASGDTVLFANETGYLSLIASSNLVTTEVLGSNSFQQITSIEYTITDSSNYTVYASGISPLGYEATVTRDGHDIPPAGTALVRFLNLCPNISIMDFLLVKEATMDSIESTGRWYDGENQDNLDFEIYQFTQIDTGAYTLKFFANNGTNPHFSDFSFQVNDQEVMTIAAIGLLNEPFPFQYKSMKVSH